MKKRVLSILLIAAMVVMLLPTLALAADTEVESGPQIGQFDYVTFDFDERACSVVVFGDGGRYYVTSGQTMYLNSGDVISGEVQMNSGYSFDMVYINGNPWVSPEFSFTVQDGNNYIYVDTSDLDTTVDLTFRFDESACSVQYRNSGTAWLNAYNGGHVEVVEGNNIPVRITLASGYSLDYATVAGQYYYTTTFDSPPLTTDGYFIVSTSRNAGRAPVITNFTSSANPTVGAAASISVSATGTSPLSYDWQIYYNGSWRDVGNGTSYGCTFSSAYSSTIYITPNTVGSYYFRCLVDNDYGEAVSGTITLTARDNTAYITNASASGIAAPVTGAVPARTAAAGASSYYVSSVQWNPATTSFAPSTAYTCWVTFTANSGYTFSPNVAAYVNGNMAVVSSGKGNTQLLVYYTFPATGGSVIVPFTDIVPSAWYYNDVVKAYQKGLIAGTTATTFSPNNNISYGEVIKLAACLHQMYNTGSVTLVGGSGAAWYQPYMTYAVNNGIIASDYSAIQANLCNRQDFVDIFYNAMPATTYTAVNSVANGAIKDYPYTGTLSCDHVYTFYRAGITVGSDGYQFKANTYITRAEVATIITRMYDSTARVTGLVLS